MTIRDKLKLQWKKIRIHERRNESFDQIRDHHLPQSSCFGALDQKADCVRSSDSRVERSPYVTSPPCLVGSRGPANSVTKKVSELPCFEVTVPSVLQYLFPTHFCHLSGARKRV